MNGSVLELFGYPADSDARWSEVTRRQHCPYLGRKCLKNRKSAPEIAIGTCTVSYGRDGKSIVTCPFRLLERKQVLTDCLHLLTLHEPGHELHVVPEFTVPGGSIDYCLVSVHEGKPVDFVGVELQALDTTGTVWPARQRFLRDHGVRARLDATAEGKAFGVNWKMTAKTTLVQLHHKVGTFGGLGKHLVLVLQDHLVEYMRRQFQFDHLNEARIADPMHFHSYAMAVTPAALRLQLAERLSTNADGIARCLGLQVTPDVDLEKILEQLAAKITPDTLMTLG